MTNAPGFRFGPFLLDRRRRRLLNGESAIHLKPKEWELLCCLVEHRDRILTKQELLDLLWPRQTVTEANLSQAVYAVRKALGESARHPRWIETVPRMGYRFAARKRNTSPAGGMRSESRSGIDPAAYAAYERGRYCWHRFTETGLRQALAFFDEALESAPRFAAAHAWRSATWSALGNIGALSPRNSAEHARRAADRAIAIDDSLASGYEMRGVVELYFDWNFEAALRSFDRAIERDPQSTNAHHLRANALAFSGDFQPAHAGIARALEIDPTSLITRTDAALFYYLAGDHESARERLISVLAQNPEFPHARLKLALVMAALRDLDAAMDECDRAGEALGKSNFGERAYVLGVGGREHAARAVLERLSAEAASGMEDPYAVALGHLGLGAVDAALEWLGQAAEYRSRNLVLLRSEPVWQPLKGHAKFAKIVNAIGYR